MNKRALAIALLLLLALAIHPVMGLEELNTSDFKEPDVTVSINGVKEKPYSKDGRLLLDKVLEKGDSIKVNYPVQPINEESAKKAVDRTYTVKTDLKNGLIEASLYYRKGGGQTFESTPGKDYMDIKVSDWEDGLREINCTIQGTTPAPSKRLQEVKAIYFDIQEAEDKCLPPVVLLVVDYSEFQSDIHAMNKRYNNLTSTLDKYSGKTDTGDLSDYLDRAHQNLSVAKSFYNDGEYKKADSKLDNTKEWLDTADREADKVQAEYAHQKAKEGLDEIASTLDEIELYLEEVKKKDVLNTSTLLDYKSEFKRMKEKVSSLSEELASAESYIDNGNYANAKSKAQNVLNSTEKINSSANSLLEELKSIISVGEGQTPQTTATPGQTKEAPAFTMPSINFKWVAIVIGVGAVLFGAGIGVRKYIRRRKWDELK